MKNLPLLTARPPKLQEKVFERLFSQAEIAKLNPEEMNTYNESQKIYWDNYSVLKTAKNEGRAAGRAEGWEEGREEGKAEMLLQIARQMKKEALSPERIEQL